MHPCVCVYVKIVNMSLQGYPSLILGWGHQTVQVRDPQATPTTNYHSIGHTFSHVLL